MRRDIMMVGLTTNELYDKESRVMKKSRALPDP